jgi:hypothetical protein
MQVCRGTTPIFRLKKNLHVPSWLRCVGPKRAEDFGLHAEVDGTEARNARAAEQAFEALTFERAAKLYRQALELCGPASPEGRRLRIGLADALANAGRGAEAARDYLAAQDEGDPAQALEMHERAARLFLISGHFDDGLRSLRMVLGAIGLRYPATPRRALLSLLFRRALLWLSGLHFKARDASVIPSGDLRRLELLWSATIGLSMVDTVRGAHMHARNLLSALRVGEPSRVARATCAADGFFSSRRASRPIAFGRCRLQVGQALEEDFVVGVGHPDVSQQDVPPGVLQFASGQPLVRRQVGTSDRRGHCGLPFGPGASGSPSRGLRQREAAAWAGG